jgi:hypothetical protein
VYQQRRTERRDTWRQHIAAERARNAAYNASSVTTAAAVSVTMAMG